MKLLYKFRKDYSFCVIMRSGTVVSQELGISIIHRNFSEMDIEWFESLLLLRELHLKKYCS